MWRRTVSWMPRPGAAPAACTCPGRGADAATRALGRRLQPAPGRGPPGGQHRGPRRRRRQGRRAARAPRAHPQPCSADLRRGARGAGGAPAPPERRPAGTGRRARARSRARRHARGAFTLAARELAFEVADGRVVDAHWDEEPRAHALVEELMLLANEAVGGLLARARRPALYRVHEHPKHEALLALAARLTALGLPVVPLPSERAARRPRRRWPGRRSCSRRSCASGRRRARPSAACSCARSNSRATTRSTRARRARLAGLRAFHLPIRRYPDIVVHRATCALAGLGETAPKARELPEVALRCSQREREAADAERRADAICLAFLLKDRLRRDGWHQPFEGVVTGLISRRPVRALRRRLRGLPAGAPPRCARALRQRRARRRARGPQLGATHPPGRRALLRRHGRRPSARAGDPRRPARERGPAPAFAPGQEDDAATTAQAPETQADRRTPELA